MEKVLPKLRFPEFDGDWEEKRLGSIANFSKGKGISKSDIDLNGQYECIRYGELYTLYSETIDKVKSKTNLEYSELVFSEENDVIIPASGETQLDIATASCVLHSGIALGGDLNIIKTKTNGVFLSYYLNNKKKLDIARLSQGISVVHLYSSQLKSLYLNIPKPKEQQKIATFLTAIDKRITLLEKQKEQLSLYKKGVMQQLFSQQIRFKDDNGKDFPDWEEKKLGEVCDIKNGFAFKSNKFKESGIPIIRISNISNYNNFIDLSNIVYYNKISNDKNFVVENGDLLIAMSGATTGKSSIYNLDVDAYLNQRIGLFKNRNTEILDYRFLTQLVFSSFFRKELDTLLVAGAQPNISSKDIESLNFNFPFIKEQKKIASFLSAIDLQIESVEKQINGSKTFKNGLLQQLFV